MNGSAGTLLPVVDEQGVFHQDRWDTVMASIARGSANAPVLPNFTATATRSGGAKKHLRAPPHWQRQYWPSGEGSASLNGTVSRMLRTK